MLNLTPGEKNSVNCIIEPNDKNQGGMWIGNWRAAKDFYWLKQNKINFVLGVIPGVLHNKVPYIENDITIHFLDAEDNENFQLNVHFNTAYNYIDHAMSNGNVLVHCGAGISRSSTCAIAYLIKKNKRSFKEM